MNNIESVVKYDVEFHNKLGYTIEKKGAMVMPNIKPISDLRNYGDVLRDVSVGSPVFLTKNGRGRYAIVDIQDYEKAIATIKLMGELEKGRKSGEEKGWISSTNVKSHFENKQNEE